MMVGSLPIQEGTICFLVQIQVTKFKDQVRHMESYKSFASVLCLVKEVPTPSQLSCLNIDQSTL